MKKVVSLLVALVLCLSCVAFAESVPSKTTGDLTKFEVVSENIPAEATLVIRPVIVEEEVYAEKIEIVEKEIVALQAAPSIVEYFGEVKTAEGEVVDLTELLATETLSVDEFCPFIVEDYEESYGKVSVKMSFATPYAKDEPVIVLVGLVEKDEMGVVVLNEDGTQKIVWIVFNGVGVETEDETGAIFVEFDAETMKAVQEGDAMMAVVSVAELEQVVQD